MSSVFAVAVKAARAGASAILDVPASAPREAHDKGCSGQNLVSEADKASETAILGIIRVYRPRDGVLTEESEATEGTTGITWIIDPLDGTTNYLHGSGYYGVSVAAQSDYGVIAAIIQEPSSGRWLSCGPDGLAGNRERAGVTQPDMMAHALLSFAVPYAPEQRRAAYRTLAHVAPLVHDLRNFGSTACDLAAVAAGEIDGFIGFNQEPWDIAAGVALVHAAGGGSRQLEISDDLHVVIAGGDRIIDAIIGLMVGH